MDISRIIFERESRNTWENAVFSKKLVSPKQDEKWLLITTGWHMPRSMGVFSKADWPVIPYPVDFQTNPRNIMRVDWDFFGHMRGIVKGTKELLLISC